ncbi:MAG: cysteine--tRNA ligase [Pseudomonadota bacterium]
MSIHVLNTLSRCKVPLVPIAPGRLKIYLCGPTVYDDPHLGHARSAVVFDVIVRYLRALGFAVTYVRNITDIDDKIITRAHALGQDYRHLGARCTARYRSAMARLNTCSPDAEPRATAHIRPIQGAIARLIQNGHAYPAGGDVYFSVASFPRYGRLSGSAAPRPMRDAGGNDGTPKRHPADFALWKSAFAGEPSWPSPWGPGRPGWHIECSAMSAHLLGDVFDIHGGGADLIFPHHENEIAQSESISGQTPAVYWLHHGMVTVHGEKMSKSTGNGLNLLDLLARHHPDALRLLLLSKRYRHPLAVSDAAMASADGSAARLNRLFAHPAVPARLYDPDGAGKSFLWTRFCSAMNDDFNFPMAISVVFDGVRLLYRRWHLRPAAGAFAGDEDPARLLCDLTFICRDILGLRINDEDPCSP